MLTSSEKKIAEGILDKIYSRKISQPFVRPVDPINDNCPNYDEIIKTPMCLNSVKEKLKNSFYDSLESWVKDVELIWSNAMTYNSPSSPIYVMAEDLQVYFRKKIAKINKTENSEWCDQVLASIKSIQNVLEKKLFEKE